MDLPLSFLWQCPQFLTRRSYFGCLNYIFKAVYGCSSLALGLKLIFSPLKMADLEMFQENGVSLRLSV